MAGYRNRPVRFYHEVSEDELYDVVVNHRSDLLTGARQILQYVARNS